VAFAPAHYHTAYAVRTEFEFLDPVMRGRFAAILRDLGALPLGEVSRAFDERRVLMNGVPRPWEPSEMVSRVDGGRAGQEVADEETRRVEFTIVPARASPAAALVTPARPGRIDGSPPLASE
jgi:hypothetical protein